MYDDIIDGFFVFPSMSHIGVIVMGAVLCSIDSDASGFIFESLILYIYLS